jgi:hypothetical protein
VRTKYLFVLVCSSVLFAAGCMFSQKTAPHMGFGNFSMNTQLSREDIVVLDQVEGTSTTDFILLGLIQIVDGKELRLLGIPFFREKYTGGFWINSIQHRAYYKALAAAPEADAVFHKSTDYEYGGIPLIWWSETAYYHGRAIRLKSDTEQNISDDPNSVGAGQKITGYRATKDSRTGEMSTYPVYEDERKK